MKRIMIIAVAIFISSVAFSQNEQSEYTKVLTELYDLAGYSDSFDTTFDRIMGLQDSMNDFQVGKDGAGFEDFKSEKMAELLVLITPIYQKYFTIDELREVIAFYHTPVGKKFGSKAGVITTESTTAIEGWAMDMVRTMMDMTQ